MAIYLITTDLKDTDPNSDLIEFEIKVLSFDKNNRKRMELVTDIPKFIKVKESVWLLKSNLKADEISFNIKEQVPDLNEFLIIEVGNDFQGNVSTSIYEWLEYHLDD